VAWMFDATAIRFEGDQHQGVGTRFECDTRIGLIRLTDVMEITEWVPQEIIGVRHVGPVSGTGRFALTDAPASSTVIAWDEELAFPWWIGGAVGPRWPGPFSSHCGGEICAGWRSGSECPREDRHHRVNRVDRVVARPLPSPGRARGRPRRTGECRARRRLVESDSRSTPPTNATSSSGEAVRRTTTSFW
jgi:hypothetical protein